jgi:hypothetical protein
MTAAFRTIERHNPEVDTEIELINQRTRVHFRSVVHNLATSFVCFLVNYFTLLSVSRLVMNGHYCVRPISKLQNPTRAVSQVTKMEVTIFNIFH